MTPYDLAKTLHRELSPFAPRLSAALNRALLEIGEGSILVGLGPGTNENDEVSFQESERISTRGDEPSHIISKIMGVLNVLENHSSWNVLIDKKPGTGKESIELMYTLYREKKGLQ
jgi:hypothetical protein